MLSSTPALKPQHWMTIWFYTVTPFLRGEVFLLNLSYALLLVCLVDQLVGLLASFMSRQYQLMAKSIFICY